MKAAVHDLLEDDPDGLWVAIDVAMEALDVGRRRIYQLARQDRWRTRGRPKQYAFSDIARTYRRRSEANE